MNGIAVWGRRSRIQWHILADKPAGCEKRVFPSVLQSALPWVVTMKSRSDTFRLFPPLPVRGTVGVGPCPGR